ncbi:MAG: hypothetical protein ABI671_18245 [Burkholderiales bacterium]
MNTFLQRTGVSFAAVLGAALSLGAAAATTHLPPERTAGVASFVSGGVGEGEAHRFEGAFKRFPLAIQLFERQGARDVYTAEARVTIRDAHGQQVFDQVAEGPFMLVRLPAGEYRVEASLKGHALNERQVHVTDSGHTVTTFVWPPSVG